MPWPIYILIAASITFMIIALMPNLLLNPKKVFLNIKKKRELGKLYQNKNTLFKSSMILKQVPARILTNNQFIVRGLVPVHFKEECIYFNIFLLGKYVFLYSEIDFMSIEKSKFSLGNPSDFIFHMKDKSCASLIIKVGDENNARNRIMEVWDSYLNRKNDD